MVPLVGNICTNLTTNGTIGIEIGANVKNGNANGTNVINQWENHEQTQNPASFSLQMTF